MFINSVKIFGLKGTKSNLLNFKLHNILSGHNGSGKTTIKDAIIFALTGKIDNTNKLDEAINNESKEIKVILDIKIKNNLYIIERIRSKTNSNFRVNGKYITQEEMSKILNGADDNKIISAISVGDFMKFEDLEKRRMLLSLTSPLNRLSIWTEITGLTECSYNLDDIQSAYKLAKNQLSIMDEKITRLSNKKIYISADLHKYRDIVFKEPTENLISLEELESNRKKLDKIKSKEPKLQQFILNNSDNGLIKLALDDELSVTNLEIHKLEFNKPNDIEFQKLKLNYGSTKENLTKMNESNVCPTCLQTYKDDTQKNLRIEELTSKLNLLELSGKKLKEEYNQQLDVWNKHFKILQDRKDTLIMKIKNIQNTINDSINLAQIKFNDNYNLWKTNFNTIKDSFDIIESNYNLQQVTHIEKNVNENNIKELEIEYTKILEELKLLNRYQLQLNVKALSSKGIEFVEINSQIKELNNLLPKNITIELLEKNKTNEDHKQCFKIYVNNVEYSWLSTGAKMKLDIILANLFNEKLGINFLFIDNAESLTLDIPLISINQYIISFAKKEDFNMNNLVIDDSNSKIIKEEINIINDIELVKKTRKPRKKNIKSEVKNKIETIIESNIEPNIEPNPNLVITDESVFN